MHCRESQAKDNILSLNSDASNCCTSIKFKLWPVVENRSYSKQSCKLKMNTFFEEKHIKNKRGQDVAILAKQVNEDYINHTSILLHGVKRRL